MINVKGIKCSTSHFSEEDNEIFKECVRRAEYWIHDTYYGYLLMLNESRYPCLRLKELGVSKSVRKLVCTLMATEGIEILIFDRDADTLAGFEIYEW